MNPRDQVAVSLTVLMLLTTGVIASLIPARRATRVSALEALRAE